jgi:hypothetical protein
MAKFESQLGSRPIQGQKMREFTIPDESGFTEVIPTQNQQSFQQQNPQLRPPRDMGPPVFDDAEMQEFNSRMQSQAPMPQMRQAPSDVEQQFAEAKRITREGKERLTESARRRIEMLIGMTRLTRDVEIDGHTYRLKALSSRELEDALSACSNFDGSIKFIFETRKQILARSLIVVANVEIDQFLGSNYLEDRLDFIDELDHSLLIRIYNEYNILAKESQDKYTLKTEAEVKEVLEDLKK